MGSIFSNRGKKPTVFWGSVEVCPPEGKIGLYDLRKVSASSKELLLDKLVIAAKELVDHARETISAKDITKEFSKDLYITVRSFQIIGDEEYSTGGLVNLNNVVAYVSNHRQHAMWNYQLLMHYKNDDIKNPNHETDPYRKIFTSTNTGITEIDMAENPKMSAVTWMRRIQRIQNLRSA